MAKSARARAFYRGAICFTLGCMSASVPVAAQVPSAAPAVELTLHDRIQHVYNDVPPADPKLELANVQALRVEVARASGVTPKDRAILEQVYASALSHNEDYPGAVKAVQVSMDIMQRTGLTDDAYQAELLQNIATYEAAAGDMQAALDHTQAALPINARLYGPQSEEVGEVWTTIGYTYSKIGRLGDAIDAYKRSITLTHPGEGKTLAYVGTYDLLGDLMNDTGDIEGALEINQKSVELARQLLPAGHRVRGITLNNMATALMHAGRYSEAESTFREAVDFAVTNRGKASFDTGRFMANLSACLIKEGRDDEAEALAITALDILKTAKSSQPEAAGEVEDSLASLAYNRGDNPLAESHFVDALAMLRRAGDKSHADATINYHLAEVRFVMGNYAGADDAVGKALAFFRKELPATSAKRTDAEMLDALIGSRRGATAQDLAQSFGRALAVGRTMETELADNRLSHQARLAIAESYRQAFTRFADIAVTAGRPDIAFHAAQLASFSEISASSQALAAREAVADPKAAELVRQVEETQSKRDQLDFDRVYALGKSDTEIAQIDTDVAALDAKVGALSAKLDASFPRYGRLSRPQPMTPATAKARLQRGQAVIMPLMGDDRMTTLVLTRDGLTADQSPLAQVAATRDIAAIRTSITSTLTGAKASGFDRSAAFELGGAILTPKTFLALKDVVDLQVMGSGSLMTLPLGLLLIAPPAAGKTPTLAPFGGDFLIKSFAVSVKPAFVPQVQQASHHATAFAGIGAPQLSDEVAVMEGNASIGMAFRGLMHGGFGDIAALRQLPDLPGASGELTAIGRALHRSGSALVLGRKATETRVKAMALDRYDVIAFATHGLIGADLANLREPALVLTPPDVASERDDGLLTASEVSQLHLNAGWVILSACNTGSGRTAGAAGYSGLATAFMHAGARNLLVSLWPVRDDVAARLSVDTVRRTAAGARQSVALRGAILSLINDPTVKDATDPAVWAPFSLVSQ